MAASGNDSAISICWIGNAQALLVRDGEIVERSRPHTLRNAALANGASLQTSAELPGILVEWIGQKPSPGVPGVLEWPWFPGDLMIMVSEGHLFDGLRSLSSRADLSPSAVARNIVSDAKFGFGFSVVVLAR
jgi:serine/threonine protein phosphatase PrpC